jgi:hypothetical protein
MRLHEDRQYASLLRASLDPPSAVALTVNFHQILLSVPLTSVDTIGSGQ